MAQEHILSAVAVGTIRRNRLVYETTEFGAAEMASFSHLSFPVLGCSQPNSRFAPGTPYDTSLAAAFSGDELAVWSAGSTALVECGGTVTAGKVVINAGDGTIVNAGGSPPFSGYVAGIAREDGTTGKVIRVLMMPLG